MKRIALAVIYTFIFVASSFAENRVVTLNSNISCNNCVKNIKEKIRFEKGVKKIETDLETKTVKITYDDKKNKADNLCEAVTKIGYKSTVVSDEAVERKKK